MNLLDKEHNRSKMLVHQPIPGYWYTSIVGQLQQVRMVLHEGQLQSRVVLENVNGRRRTVDLDGWYRLDLTLHSPGNERRRRRGSGDSSDDSS
ncbi:MAG: hypothetical protein GWP20_02055 [Thermotogales bacterium]|nr:hypothetical protein [Thermotogales bacterium]